MAVVRNPFLVLTLFAIVALLDQRRWQELHPDESCHSILLLFGTQQ